MEKYCLNYINTLTYSFYKTYAQTKNRIFNKYYLSISIYSTENTNYIQINYIKYKNKNEKKY